MRVNGFYLDAYILQSTNLKALAKDAGIFFADNKGQKSFDLINGQLLKHGQQFLMAEIMKKEAESMFKYLERGY